MTNLSVIIAVRPGVEPAEAIAAIKSCENKSIKMEIIIVEGRTPSRQRNVAVASAHAEIVYFLDDDATVDKGTISAGLAFLQAHPEVGVIGGPTLTRLNASTFEHAVGFAMGSPIIAAHTGARHRALDSVRSVSGEELSLCNLMVRKHILLSGGFREHLYPSEDPEFLKRIRRSGEKLVYLPEMRVFRSRRKNLGALWRQFYRYGQGRACHIFEGIAIKDIIFFLPSLLLLFLILSITTNLEFPRLVIVTYLCAILTFSFVISLSRRQLKLFGYVLIACLDIHIAYATGFLRALLFGVSKIQENEVVLRRIEL